MKLLQLDTIDLEVMPGLKAKLSFNKVENFRTVLSGLENKMSKRILYHLLIWHTELDGLVH